MAAYLALLAAASAAAFAAAFLLGRKPSLEEELGRRAAPPPGDRAGSGIPSLRPPPPPPPAPPLPPAAERPLGEGLQVRLEPVASPGAVLVLDLESLELLEQQTPEGPRRLREGVLGFLRTPPGGVSIGLRTLDSDPGTCGATARMLAPGGWTGAELVGSFERALARERGPRNVLHAVERAAADMDPVPGERAVILVAGGEEQCGAYFCGEDAPPVPATMRVNVLRLSPEPRASSGRWWDDVRDVFAPPADPWWVASLKCLAGRTGGSYAAVSDPGDLETALRRITRSLESALEVRVFHFTGQEVRGLPLEDGPQWGAEVAERGSDGPAALQSVSFPARFSLPAGSWDLKVWYAGLEKKATVVLAAGERAVVQAAFTTGELFVQARDPAGTEIVGDSAGFGCPWGAEVLSDTDGRLAARTCSLPARLELPTGSYRVRVHWKGQERIVEGISIENGATVVRAVAFEPAER